MQQTLVMTPKIAVTIDNPVSLPVIQSLKKAELVLLELEAKSELSISTISHINKINNPDHFQEVRVLAADSNSVLSKIVTERRQTTSLLDDLKAVFMQPEKRLEVQVNRIAGLLLNFEQEEKRARETKEKADQLKKENREKALLANITLKSYINQMEVTLKEHLPSRVGAFYLKSYQNGKKDIQSLGQLIPMDSFYKKLILKACSNNESVSSEFLALPAGMVMSFEEFNLLADSKLEQWLDQSIGTKTQRNEFLQSEFDLPKLELVCQAIEKKIYTVLDPVKIAEAAAMPEVPELVAEATPQELAKASIDAEFLGLTEAGPSSIDGIKHKKKAIVTSSRGLAEALLYYLQNHPEADLEVLAEKMSFAIDFVTKTQKELPGISFVEKTFLSLKKKRITTK